MSSTTRGVNGFILFKSETTAEIKKDVSIDKSKVQEMVKERWAALTSDEKLKFNERAKQKREAKRAAQKQEEDAPAVGDDSAPPPTKRAKTEAGSHSHLVWTWGCKRDGKDAVVKVLSTHPSKETASEHADKMDEDHPKRAFFVAAVNEAINFTESRRAFKKHRPKKNGEQGLTGYTLFVKENRKDILSKNPDSTSKDAMALIAVQWKKLSDQQRTEYKQRVAQMRS